MDLVIPWGQARPLDVDLLEHDLEYSMGLRSIGMFNDEFGLSVGQDGIQVAEAVSCDRYRRTTRFVDLAVSASIRLKMMGCSSCRFSSRDQFN